MDKKVLLDSAEDAERLVGGDYKFSLLDLRSEG